MPLAERQIRKGHFSHFFGQGRSYFSCIFIVRTAGGSVVFSCLRKTQLVCSAAEAYEPLLHIILFPSAHRTYIIFLADGQKSAARTFYIHLFCPPLLPVPVVDSCSRDKEGANISVLRQYEEISRILIEIHIIPVLGVFVKYSVGGRVYQIIRKL